MSCSVQRRSCGLAVAEPDALEAHLAEHLRRAQLDRVLGLDDVDRQVEVLEDPVEQGERGLDVGADAEQRLDREQQPRLERREGDDGADRDRRAPRKLWPASQ